MYLRFELFRAPRPWVHGEAVRPKGIAREMVELQESFANAINRLQVDRAEGVLLRYLAQVFRTLERGVPIDAQTDGVVEILAYLRTLLARTDDSLLTSWEAMVEGDGGEGQPQPDAPIDISEDLRSFRARIRAERHALVRALAAGDFDEAEGGLRHDEESAFDAAALRAAILPFEEEYGPLCGGHRAIRSELTTIRPDGRHRWQVSHRLLPDDVEVELEEVGWVIDAVVDLRDDTNPAGPLLRGVAIGE